MTVVKTDTEGTQSRGGVLGDSLDFIKVGTLLSKSCGKLVNQDGSSKTSIVSSIYYHTSNAEQDLPPSDDRPLLSAHSDIITDHQDPSLS